MKQLLMTTIAIFGLVLISNAQVPNYVPSNGLVGWWPFSGNANDESLNGNNGTVNGASLSEDRYENAENSYFFNGQGNGISLTNNTIPIGNSSRSISVWFKMQLPLSNSILSGLIFIGNNTLGERFGLCYSSNEIKVELVNSSVGCPFTPDSSWHNFIVTYPLNGIGSSSINIYLDGLLMNNYNIINPVTILNTSANVNNGLTYSIGSLYDLPGYFWEGQIDDIGIWNRSITQEEITELFNASNCSNNLSISPASNQLQSGSLANFIATTSDSNPSFVWQSDFGQGFQTLNNYGNYSGVNTNSLSISNVQLSEHNQPIRVISTSGECIDTSNVATINITDTCIVTINDTITTLISVTDTLVINTIITGLTPPNNSNTIKVFPNPANSHITIDFGSFASMNGYILKITNSIGQIVFTTPINQQSSYVDLSTWSGNGIYFVQVIDSQNNTIENRKIVLQ